MRGDSSVRIDDTVIEEIEESILELAKKFSDYEERGHFYGWSMDLIDEAKENSQEKWWLAKPAIRSLLLILYTWNARGMFRREGKLAYEDMKRLLEQIPDIEWLVTQDSLTSFDFENDDERLAAVYNSFQNDYPDVEGFGDVGASKVMHLLNPELTVMWDDEIRVGWGEREETGNFSKWSGSSINFIRFQKAMKQIALELEKDDKFREYLEDEDKTTAKIIDEYNYQKFTV